MNIINVESLIDYITISSDVNMVATSDVNDAETFIFGKKWTLAETLAKRARAELGL